MKKTVLLAVVLFVAVGALLSAGGKTEAKPKALVNVTWMAPRPTLEVMDDYPLWVAKKLGYFEELGLNVNLIPSPQDSMAPVKFLDQKQADISFPSPAVLATGVGEGLDCIMAFEMALSQVFDFAVAEGNTKFKFPDDLKGSTISLWDAGGRVVVDPILVELGIDPSTVTYVSGGPVWGKAVDSGQAEVAFLWEGLRAQWDAVGLKLKYFLGSDFSIHPSNGYAVRKSDLKDPAKKELYGKFMRATAMGIEFARNNPRAAAQIVYDQFPPVREMMKPELALESMRQLHWLYVQPMIKDKAYGTLEEKGWNNYLSIIYKMEQITKPLKFGDTCTNELISAANQFDRARVKKDAANFQLNDTWKNVAVTGDW